MSTVTRASSRKPREQQADDPFRYGWRYVEEETAEGTMTRQVPLTEEDVLHPQEYDFIVNTPWHQIICSYLKNSFLRLYAGKKGAVVLGDTRVDWQVPQGWYHGPDLALFFGAKKPMRKSDATFYVKTSRARPVLVIEVTSPSTSGKDHVAKKREYDLVGVPFYVIVDLPERDDLGPIILYGFKAGTRHYESVPLDERGRLWLEPVELWLGVDGDAVYLEKANGERILGADGLDARVEELEAELARIRKQSKK